MAALSVNPMKDIRLVVRSLLGRGGGTAGYMVRGTAGSLLLRVGGVALNALAMLVLARWLGAEQYGIYVFATSLLMLLGPVAGLGLGQVVSRVVAGSRATGDMGAVSAVTGFVRRVFFLWPALLAALAALAVGAYDYTAPGWPYAVPLVIAVAALPFSVFMGGIAAVLRGVRLVLLAQLPENVVRPLVLLAGGAFLAAVGWVPAEARVAVMLHVGATVVALLCAAAAYGWARPRFTGSTRSEEAVAGRGESPRDWLRAGGYLLVGQLLFNGNAQADIVMLGMLAAPEDVGIYHVAARLAGLVSLLIGAATLPLGPRVAELWRLGETARLQHEVTRITRALFIGALAAFAVLALLGKPGLRLFGGEYDAGYLPLVVLALAHLLNVAAGPVKLLLVMTRHERDTMIGLACGTAANIALNAALIPPLGMLGAALATLAGWVIWNGILYVTVSRKINVHCSFFGETFCRRTGVLSRKSSGVA
ncbi:lipopolysaccharide biosynthesis protein [Geminicoccaceae bacterium 1502E]|nr:lipopolysaccharide biosynthesis protein [Geminicoccaceae bacterium 1502E]